MQAFAALKFIELRHDKHHAFASKTIHIPMSCAELNQKELCRKNFA